MELNENQFEGLKTDLTFGVVQRGTGWEKNRYRMAAQAMKIASESSEYYEELRQFLDDLNFEDRIDLCVMAAVFWDLVPATRRQLIDLSQFVGEIRDSWAQSLAKLLMDYGQNQLPDLNENMPVVVVFAGPIKQLAASNQKFRLTATSGIADADIKIESNGKNYLKATLEVRFNSTEWVGNVRRYFNEDGWTTKSRNRYGFIVDSYTMIFGGDDFEWLPMYQVGMAAEMVQLALSNDSTHVVIWDVKGKTVNPIDVEYFKVRTRAIKMAHNPDPVLDRLETGCQGENF